MSNLFRSKEELFWKIYNSVGEVQYTCSRKESLKLRKALIREKYFWANSTRREAYHLRRMQLIFTYDDEQECLRIDLLPLSPRSHR